jgi:hypothetical protein
MYFGLADITNWPGSHVNAGNSNIQVSSQRRTFLFPELACKLLDTAIDIPSDQAYLRRSLAFHCHWEPVNAGCDGPNIAATPFFLQG